MSRNSMRVAARLAAATALTGSLTACDGRFGRAADALFAPISSEPVAAEPAATPPAAPGNPVYINGSRARNNAAYEQAYGAPIEGSGQTIDTGARVGYAPSVYDDGSISQTTLQTTTYSSPVTETEGAYSTYSTLPAETTYGTMETAPMSTPVYESEYSAPVDPYNAPNSTFPAIGEEVYPPQSSLPVNEGLFTDASYQPNGDLPMSVAAEPVGVETAYVIESARDVAPLLEPYGSTASHRYSAPEPQPIVSHGIISEHGIFSEKVLSYGEPLVATQPLDADAVQVAFLADGYVPMPRLRPARSTALHAASLDSPIPVKRPELAEAVLRSPLPLMRPTNRVSVTARAITDAPALTDTPEMIEVDVTYADDSPVVEEGTEVAALSPAPEMPASKAAEAGTETRAPVPAPEPGHIEVAALETLDDASMEEARELSGTSWRLTTLNGATVDGEAELHFDGTSGFAGGQSFCNNYGGEFLEKLDGTFDMANIFSTETSCEHLTQEKKYIVALERAARYRVEPGMKELKLIGPDGDTIATFSAF